MQHNPGGNKLFTFLLIAMVNERNLKDVSYEKLKNWAELQENLQKFHAILN